MTCATRPRIRPRLRPRLPFEPKWEGPINGYAINAIRGLWPRVAAYYEFEDLLQEAHLAYLICARRYGTVCDNPKWFMALFKTVFRNRLCDLLNSVSRYSSIEAEGEVEVMDIGFEIVELVDALSEDLRLVLSDLIRPKSRLKITDAMRDQLVGVLRT